MSLIIRVVLVYDKQLVCAGLSRMLSMTPDLKVVGEANSGEEALKICQELKPDVVVMDLEISEIERVEVARELLKVLPDAKILVMSDAIDPSSALQREEVGAIGFIHKTDDENKLFDSMRTRSKKKDSFIRPSAELQIKARERKRVASPFNDLSERELQVVLLLANGLKTKTVAKKLGIQARTIKTYRARMFVKLKVDNNVELTLLARRYGFLDALEEKIPNPLFELEASSVSESVDSNSKAKPTSKTRSKSTSLNSKSSLVNDNIRS